MVIAVNTISFIKQEGNKNFIYECFSRIAKSYPEHTFLLISSQPYEYSIFPANIITVVLQPLSINQLLLKFWYRYKISLVLKKYRACLCITVDASFPLPARLPRVLIISDPVYLYDREIIVRAKVKNYKKNISKFLKKAKVITTLSEFCKNEISKNYQIQPSKIVVISSGVPEIFKPAAFDEKEKVRQEYSDGNEYFLFPATIYDEKILLNLLKAFSIFKKWQKSSMQLLIVSGIMVKSKEYQKHLRLFKYKKDVKLLDNITVEKMAKITAAAYVMLYTFKIQGFNVPPMQAMKCNVPVITGNFAVIAEVCGDAALYVDALNHEDIAKNMMMVFKDEKLKRDLIEKGMEQVKRYSWEKTNELLWESILKASG